jgi:hypothetical protein
MKSLVIVFLIVNVISSGTAQIAEPKQNMENIDNSVFGLGFSAGAASGFGLSFRHHLPGDFSYQIIAGVIKADNKTLYNVGGELQYDFVRGGTARFFGGGALGYFYKGSSSNELKGPFRIGLGIGGELQKLDPFYIAGELLFTYFTDGTILPLPQISAHYYFN